MSHSLLTDYSDWLLSIDRITKWGTPQYFPEVMATIALESL